MNTQSAEWTVEGLQRLSRQEALSLFATLPPPSAMTGEFSGYIPAYIEPEWRAFLGNAKIGHWMGKGYIPESYKQWSGHGYNIYQTESSMMRRLRFGWSFGASSLDARPALLMHYAAFENWAGSHELTDEVREARPGLLLGVYYTRDVIPGFTPRAGHRRTEPEIFILSGPVGAVQCADRD